MLEFLIKDGEQFEKFRINNEVGEDFIDAKNYQEWVKTSAFYLEQKYGISEVVKEFIEISKNVENEGYSQYNRMMGILKAVKKVEDDKKNNIKKSIETIANMNRK